MAEEARLLLETLSDLRVVDLKRELEKRKLSKSGSKKELCERLKNHLKNEEPKLRNAEKNLDSISSLNLASADAGMENNEFVKSYLEQREKLLERQMEQKKKYQEEAYKSQESESQSEAEDLSQHHQYDAGKSQESESRSDQANDACQEAADNKDSQESKEVCDLTTQERPEYNSETDEDTEDESGNYSTTSSGVTAKEPERVACVQKYNVDASASNDDDDDDVHPTLCDSVPKEVGLEEEKSESQDVVSEAAEDGSGNAGHSVEHIFSSVKEDNKPLEESNVMQESADRTEEALESSGTKGDLDESGETVENEVEPVKSDDADVAADADVTSEKITESEDAVQAKEQDVVEEENIAEKENVVEHNAVEGDDIVEHDVAYKENVAENDIANKENIEGNEVVGSSCAAETPEETMESRVKSDEEGASETKEETNSPKHSVVIEETLEVTIPKEDEFDEIKAPIENPDDRIASMQASPTGNNNEQKDKKSDPCGENASKKLLRTTQNAGDAIPQDKPARKRKWGSVELDSQPVTISSDSLKGLIPDVMIDLSVPCDAMMDVIGSEDIEVDAKSKIFKRQSEETSAQHTDDGKRRRTVNAPQTSGNSTPTVKLGRTIYQEVGDIPTIQETNESTAFPEAEKHRERRVVERKASGEGEVSERNVVQRKEVEQSQVDAENASKKRRVNPILQPVDEPVAVERGRREMTPPRNPVSRFIHIFNLVRPYTLHQLKEILQRTGTLIESGFWIDKIKSHCIAEYETSEQALASREALHGKKWPACNPKILRVDFSDENELEVMKSTKDGAPMPQRQKISRPVQGGMGLAAATSVVAATAAATADAIKVVEATVRLDESRRTTRDSGRPQEKPRDRELGRRREERDRRREDAKKIEGPSQHPVREWDKNKVGVSVEREAEKSIGHRKRSGSRHRDETESKRPKRSDAENEMPPKRSQKEEPPAKLLDDLFRKTKATPCIYWLPLTEEQIAEKEKQNKKLEAERMQRRAERDKKLEEERDERMKARALAQRDREGDRRRDF